MTNLPNPGSEPSPNAQPPENNQRHRRGDRPWQRRVRQIGIPLSVVTLAGIAGGLWWGRNFVYYELVPLVETNLSQTLKRPVNLGKVEAFSLTSLKIGPSAIPATPTDPDWVSLAGVDISFNPLKILLTRELNLDITLRQPEIYLEQDKTGAWVTTELREQEEQGPIRTEIDTVRVRDGRAILVPRSKFDDNKKNPVTLANLNGNLRFSERNTRFVYELAGRSTTGGKVDLNGETVRPSLQTNLKIRGQNFLVSEIDRLVNFPGISLQSGRVTGDVAIQYQQGDKIPGLGGSAEFTGVTLKVPQVPQAFRQAKGRLQLDGDQIRLRNVDALYGKVPFRANGVTDLNDGFNITANVRPVSVPTLLETLQVPLPFSTAGEVRADLKLTGALQSPILTGTGRSTKSGRLDKVDLSQYSAQFRLDAGQRLLTFTDIAATPTAGGRVTGGGRIRLDDPAQVALVFDAVNVPGDAIARSYNNGNPPPFTIGTVNARAQITGPATNIQTLATWQAPNGTYPATGQVQVANGVITLRNTTATVAGGTITANARAANGRWQATVAGAGVQLSQFSRDLRGQFSGNLALAGSLSSFRPADVRGQGQVRFSQGISVIGEPLTAQIRWDGQKVVVQNATAPGFSANGAVYAQLEGQGAPAIAGLDLNVNVRDYSLRALALPLPTTVDYSGRVDFNGRVTGTPTNPSVAGGLALRQFVLNGVAFEPVMRGNLRVARGVNLDVAGQQDRIAVTLNSNYQPVAFYIRQDEAIAQGRAQGELLLVDVKDFPVAFLNPPGMAVLFPASGELNGTFALNLRDYSGSGQLTIAQPALGTYRADQFGGRISYKNGVVTLTGAELRRGTTVFQIDTTASLLGGSPQVKSQIRVAQGNLQDVLGLLQLFDLQDLTRGMALPTYGTAADIDATPIDLRNASILDQLRRLSEIQALQAQERAEREIAAIPPLEDLKGTFSGELNVTGSLRTGISADFDIRGENWEWGPYSAREMVAKGSFENGVVTLLPLRFQSGDAFIAFSGQIGGNGQSGQFRMANVPIESFKRLVPLPLAVSGNVNATATLAGTLANPQAIGEISLTNGVLNGEELQEARGSFQYANARLDFGSTVIVTAPQPITVSGSVPLPLPFTTAAPASDQISLDINVKDEGLAVLNLLNNQVEWLDGKGSVALNVRGTLQNPDAKGEIRVQDATLKARALPDPLTDVDGLITLNQDRIQVETVSGKYGDGRVVASGVLPIAQPFTSNDPDAGKFINVNLDKITLNLKGLYRGNVNGEIQVAGTALNPQIGGGIQLSRGEVLLSDPPEQTTAEGVPSEESPIEFSNLKLTLGNSIRIVRAPILNFVAVGDLIINGNLNDPRPAGIISLKSGQVNLFTTQFNLARGYPQTAEFDPRQGLDPNLNIRLVALVAEVSGNRMPTSSISSSEIADTPDFYRYGSLQSVRVRAQINGPASQLNENLVLTSSPARSPAEIVALIGGGFVSTLGQGGGALELANLAGSALLTNIQSFIGNALGLSEFRLFPTITPNQDSRESRRESNLDLAMEAGIDITPSLSVSVLKIITSDQPAQFGLRYRLNDNFLFRGSTDFSGDNRAVLEYEARF